jgi:predicted nuclease of restriction endonuclease-like (RecB) superfamily
MSETNIELNKYKEIFENVKNEILQSQYKAMQVVNKELIYMYWHIGKIILDNFKWGNKFIDNLSIDLKMEFPNIQGFSVRNLKYMKKMAEEYPDFEFVQEVLAQITWYHNIILMDKIKDIDQRKWYIKEIVKNGWSTNVLKMQIKNKVYERQAIADKITNFEKTLPNVQSDLAMQTLKDPYIFDFIALKGQVKEKEIENAMITKIKDVLLELRNRICICWKSIQINC